jgi:hypothetical protein
MGEGAKFSLSLGAKKPEHTHSHQYSQHRHSNGTKRPHAALHDSDDEDGVDGGRQEITHFDKSAGGALHSEKKPVEKKLLVIPVGENSRKRQKSGLPSQNTETAEAAAAEAKAKAKPTTYGLNVQAKGANDEVASTEEAEVKDTDADSTTRKKTADEEALAALLGNKKTSNTVIPALTEEEIFERDYAKAPDAPTEADYDAVPIEEFGAAMLRGMGWKDGEAIGRNKGQAPLKQRNLERRPELLGVGAKPAKALGIELGEWGKHAKKHERKINQAYAPVMLKNKKTGEMITEEEMQTRLTEQEMGFVDEEDDKKNSRREKDWSRERDRERDSDDRKKSSSRRNRSRSEDDRRRRRDGDDDSDRERRERRRERERRRRDRSESEVIQRSRKDDKFRDKDRERRHRDDDRSYRKEKSYRDRSDRDRR